jgi:glutathionyl-hydroquinone reductase
MRLIDADLAIKEIPNEIKDYTYWLEVQPTVFDIKAILTELDKRIGTQLKIIAGLNDPVYRYGFAKSLEAYQQCRMILEDAIQEKR